MLASFRNPAGIALRLRNFGRHKPDAPPGRDAGVRPGGAVDVQVWQQFRGNPIALAEEVARIRRSISAGDWILDNRSSRGPVPAFGPRISTAADGQTSVYLLLINGPIDILAPQVKADGRTLVKIGRTNDLDRRMAELPSGLPPAAAIYYAPISLRLFRSATDAHKFEQPLSAFATGPAGRSVASLPMRPSMYSNQSSPLAGDVAASIQPTTSIRSAVSKFSRNCA